MPRKSENVPSVTMSGGNLSRVISTAFSAPPSDAEQQRQRDRRPASAAPASRHSAPSTTADEPHHRADREIDPAGDDDRRQREREQPDLHGESRDLERVARRREVVPRHPEDERTRRGSRRAAPTRCSGRVAPRATRARPRPRQRATAARRPKRLPCRSSRASAASATSAARMMAPGSPSPRTG